MLLLLNRLFEHMAWADRRLLTLFDTAVHNDDAARLFSHLLAAERVWLQRILKEDASQQQIWPQLALPEMHAMAAANRREYDRLLRALTEKDVGERLEYTNSQGKPFRTALGDILMHVALHGSYHRGQIAVAVRAAGGEPVNTDYITFAREPGLPARTVDDAVETSDG